jgi:hypothetical protein
MSGPINSDPEIRPLNINSKFKKLRTIIQNLTTKDRSFHEEEIYNLSKYFYQSIY